ncbi:MAG: hypothetical protein HW402_155 [Dehalococcoidales bacterium]|nr:hypothetical protein [Dehalococcoidales bacterium]
MIIFFAILLTVLVFAFIGYPLLKPRPSTVGAFRDENTEELHSRRDTTYSMLKELEFDYQSGILAEEDYHDLTTKYKEKAISILKDIDSVGGGSVAEDEIEKKVRELRRGNKSSPGKTGPKSNAEVEAEVEKQVQERRHNVGQFCTQCGARHKPGDRFCSHCGARV